MEKMGLMEVLFITFNHNVTFLGKTWLILVVLRLLIFLFSGYPLFRDEQERFVCNTIQPGCTNVCFDSFTPLSLFRFWLFQLIMLCLPHLMFISYIIHKVLSTLRIRGNYFSGSRSQTGAGSLCTPLHALPKGTPNFVNAYLLDVILRILLEAAFSAGQYYLYGFSVPRSFQCYEFPCTSMVECYISSPTEKTIMLNFMLGAASLSLLLNLADLVCSVQWMVTQRTRRKGRLLMNGGIGEDMEVLYHQNHNTPKTVIKRGQSHIDKPTSNCNPNGDLSHRRVRINDETRIRVAVPPLQRSRLPRRDAKIEPPFRPIPMGAPSSGRFVHPNHISRSSSVPLSRRLERDPVVVSRQFTPSPMYSGRKHSQYTMVDATLLEQHYDSAESRDRLLDDVNLQEVRGSSSSSSDSSSSTDAQ